MVPVFGPALLSTVWKVFYRSLFARSNTDSHTRLGVLAC